MPDPTSLADIDLTPLPGKTYFNIDREWREEFIYFVLPDRFQDSQSRTPVSRSGRSSGFAAPNDFYGGTLKGITNHLDYIAGLGCTAIWLAPVFKNNAKSYHGYDINNYLSIDPHFGTKQDLIDLVNTAHAFVRNDEPWPIRIILDVVINHSGNNWSYQNDDTYFYWQDWQFPFGSFRPNPPFPVELQNQDWYHRRGRIRNYDTPPENQRGDIASLKDFANDDTPTGSAVINALIKIYAYWIREADVDGFRMDAVKHMGDVACSRFCSNIREYAYTLGKRNFFLFGEVASPSDDLYNSYIGQNTSVQDGNQTVYFGLNSVLDFRLAEGVFGDPNNVPLRDVLKANAGPNTLFNRLQAQQQRALNRGELGRYLVTFMDNHDSFWQPGGRFSNGAADDQVIAAIGFLLCWLGTPCIYYGTEQGFTGQGGDEAIREAMFDPAPGGDSLLNTNCNIYKAISALADVVHNNAALRFGRIYLRPISGDGGNFGLPFGHTYTLAFSRLLYPDEVLVAYNVSGATRSDYVLVDSSFHGPSATMNFLYGGSGSVPVQTAADGTRFVQLTLSPHQFVVLS